MGIPFFQVDAFADRVFSGNPAAVCLLDSWPADGLLQQVAQENNLPETAFLVRINEEYQLRWFTPTLEIDLCGHATLASGFVLRRYRHPDCDSFRFHTRSGILVVTHQDDLFTLDFPSRPGAAVPTPLDITLGLGGIRPVETLLARDHLVVFESEAQIRALRPDFALLNQLGSFGVIATAPGDTVDFVSRFFAPKAGINEDPATGSAHCTLIPYWAARLGKRVLHGRQLSQRTGEFYCEDRGDRVRISGRASLYCSGTLAVDL